MRPPRPVTPVPSARCPGCSVSPGSLPGGRRPSENRRPSCPGVRPDDVERRHRIPLERPPVTPSTCRAAFPSGAVGGSCVRCLHQIFCGAGRREVGIAAKARLAGSQCFAPRYPARSRRLMSALSCRPQAAFPGARGQNSGRWYVLMLIFWLTRRGAGAFIGLCALPAAPSRVPKGSTHLPGQPSAGATWDRCGEGPPPPGRRSGRRPGGVSLPAASCGGQPTLCTTALAPGVLSFFRHRDLSGTAPRPLSRSRTTSARTGSQSAWRGWRYRRSVGYHGLSRRPRSQRQSGSKRSSSQTGLPRAAARWATAVSTEDDEVKVGDQCRGVGEVSHPIHDCGNRRPPRRGALAL